MLALSCGGEGKQESAPEQDSWARERVEALEGLYGFNPEGARFLDGVDLRQMVGQPGWFGSFGYDGWTGVGEAKPGPVIHELGHAYWGAFPVSGRPELSWDEVGPEGVSTAMARYHRDLLAFMAQPPDPFEPLRERMRNIPEVLLGEEEPLLHFGEADLVHTTGGNLLLLPPILRRYFDQLLLQGSLDSWHSAVEWYQGLSPDDRRWAGVYFGLPHLSLERYADLRPLEDSELPGGVAETVGREERQRLVDFALQFDDVTDAEGAPGEPSAIDLFFLRGYLADKLALYKRHPEALSDLKADLPLAADLGAVLQAFASADGRPLVERADSLGPRLKEPLFSLFWPLVDNALLMELYSRGVVPADAEPRARATDGEIARLGRIVSMAGAILSKAAEDPARGVDALEDLIGATGEGEVGELGLTVELLRAADGETASAIGRELDGDMVRRLLDVSSGALRQLLGPQELLDVLGITAEATADGMVRGVQELLQGTSGNFRIDRPYLSRVYELLARRGEARPQEVLDILLRSGLLVEDLLREHPEAAVAILRSDLERAGDLIAGVEGYARTPQRLIHSIISVDHHLAALLVFDLDGRDPVAVRESLIHFAYDSYRKARLPSLEISPAEDGHFLESLADQAGDQWVIERMATAISTYDGLAEDGTVPADFIDAYRATLKEAVSTSANVDGGLRLRGLAEAAFAEAGLAF